MNTVCDLKLRFFIFFPGNSGKITVHTYNLSSYSSRLSIYFTYIGKIHWHHRIPKCFSNSVGHATFSWICSMNMQHSMGLASRTCSMEHVAWTCRDMQHRHDSHEAWACSIHIQHVRTDWTSSMDNWTCIHPIQEPYISLCPVDLDSGTMFPVWCGTGGKKRFFFCTRRFCFFELPSPCIALHSRPRKREKKQGRSHLPITYHGVNSTVLYICTRLLNGKDMQILTISYRR
jgi:hypothetical protein